MFCTFTTVVLLTTTLFTTRGPPQPRQEGRCAAPRGHHPGTTRPPQPRATHPTGGPDHRALRLIEEDHERRRIDRSSDHRARRPRPEPIHETPAPGVIRRPAPGCRVHPGPAVHGIQDP